MSSQPNPSLQVIMSSLSDAQRRMLLQISHSQPVEPRNAAVRAGLAERGLIDVIAPPSRWEVRLTQLGHAIVGVLPDHIAQILNGATLPSSVNGVDVLIALADGEESAATRPVDKWISCSVFGLIAVTETGNTITPQGRTIAAALKTLRTPTTPTAINDIDLKALIDATIIHSRPEDMEGVGAYTIGHFTPTGAEYAFTDTEQDAIQLAKELSDVWVIARDGIYISDSSKGTPTVDTAPTEDTAPDAESIARTLNSQQRLILDELNRRKSMLLTENQALHRGNLKDLGLIEVEGKSITITLLGEKVMDAASFLEITGEYEDDPAESDAPTDEPSAPAPTVEPNELNELNELNEPAVTVERTLLEEVEYLRQQILEMAEDSHKKSRAEISRGDHNALKLHGKQLNIIRQQSNMANARAERAEKELAALKSTPQPVTNTDEIAKLRESIGELQKQVDRQSFNHKRQLEEKDAAAAKLRREIDTLTTERDAARRDATNNAREFVTQANAAQELREQVEALQATIERIKPATGSATQYRIARNTNEIELAKMHAAGWGVQHMQFMPDGALHVVFVHAPAPQQHPAQPPLHAVVTTDTQEAEIIEITPDPVPNVASVTFTEPPTPPTPAPLNATVVIDNLAHDEDPDGVNAMRQMMRAGVSADQISATLNDRNLEQARANFTTRQQQAAEFKNPPANRPAPPPRRFIPSTN